MPFDLVAYGMLMAGLGFAVGRFVPGLQSLAHLAGAAGAGAGLLFALLIWCGKRHPAFTALSLLAVGGIATKLCLEAWKIREAEESGGRIAFAVAALMIFLSVAQAMIVAFGNKNAQVEPFKGER
jgi:hypothetical protein